MAQSQAIQPQPFGAAGMPLTQKRESLWQDAVRRLMRNRAAVLGGSIIVILVISAIFAPLIAIKPFDEQVLVDQNKVPQWIFSVFPSLKSYAKIANAYPLGADYVGRDLFSRIVYGSRVSLSVAFIGPLISLLVGIVYGSVSGYFGGRVDNVMMRIVDVLYAFPSLLFIILLMAFFRSSAASHIQPGTLAYSLSQLDAKLGGMLFIFVGIGLTAWETMARLTRGQVLSVREKEFIEAAHTIGAGNLRIMFRHILPNVLGPLIVNETLAIPSYIATEAFLSFIGLGVNPPTPSWGAMTSDGARNLRTYPNQAIFPALALAITMFAFNFLGDGLRDAFDPRLRGTQ
jgi:oligopeptide transport system permease protein